MKIVITGDGSSTFYSEKYEELFHSKSGALEESFEKFVKPCKVEQGMDILDICFGLGYNSLAAIDSASHINIVALEKDKEVLASIQELKVPESLREKFEIIKKLAVDHYYKDDKFELKIILGDAVLTIQGLNKKFDAVFHDPFSTVKNPELWTVDFFKSVKACMKKGAILATYSYARLTRENLKKAGFLVKDGPIVGRRSPCTLAVNY